MVSQPKSINDHNCSSISQRFKHRFQLLYTRICSSSIFSSNRYVLHFQSDLVVFSFSFVKIFASSKLRSTIFSTQFQYWKLDFHYQVQKLRFVQDCSGLIYYKFVEIQYCFTSLKLRFVIISV
ncbi:hypothetical protein RchiOBHm_Chr6g0249191 [Rosa chinensis]|uniref:Uncharacterized protein n=1 Tax=Rosa chinensis TaxID=74649 RepID=A0A2P6PKA0_ROSCH|nr:hypothetical protein RchiOBHm_Chr6g0249191 [Rosa chinensis]